VARQGAGEGRSGWGTWRRIELRDNEPTDAVELTAVQPLTSEDLTPGASGTFTPAPL
jgi:hypothetical protein